jgi:hypothetical protein
VLILGDDVLDLTEAQYAWGATRRSRFLDVNGFYESQSPPLFTVKMISLTPINNLRSDLSFPPPAIRTREGQVLHNVCGRSLNTQRYHGLAIFQIFEILESNW